MCNIKKSIKLIVKAVIGFIYRFHPFLRHRVKNGLTIFVFHEISDNPSEFTDSYGLSVTPDQFLNQIKWIQGNFNIISPVLLLNDNACIPLNAAIITFDDGFLGVFENGYPILKQLKIPSIMFLNMKPVLDRGPMLSALVCYLNKYNKRFIRFVDEHKLIPPYHLSMRPDLLQTFLSECDDVDFDQIKNYQGKIVTKETLLKWDEDELVYYANHFYDHWNAAALSSKELEEQYLSNDNELINYSSHINLLAFTNGKPNSCFNLDNLDSLKRMGVKKLFSSVNGINPNHKPFLLGRLSINQNDVCSNHLWYRLGEAYARFFVLKE